MTRNTLARARAAATRFRVAPGVLGVACLAVAAELRVGTWLALVVLGVFLLVAAAMDNR